MGGQTFSQNIAFKKVTPQYDLKLVKLNSKEDLGIFNDIHEDDEGYVWLSSANGLHVFDGNKTISYTDGKRQFGLNIDSIQKPFIFFTQAGKNQFWVQQSGGRIILMDSDKREVRKIIQNKWFQLILISSAKCSCLHLIQKNKSFHFIRKMKKTVYH